MEGVSPQDEVSSQFAEVRRVREARQDIIREIQSLQADRRQESDREMTIQLQPARLGRLMVRVSQSRDLDGNSELVRQYIIGLDEFGEFQKNAISMLEFLIPLFKKEGKTDFSLGVGCTGGKHRSVVVANELKKLLECTDNLVFISHQDLNNA